MTLGDDFFDNTTPLPCRPLPEQSQLDFDIEFYHQILARNADHVDVLRRLVEIHARRGEHSEALLLDRRLVRVRPLDPIAHYNLACSLSVLGNCDEALEALDKSLTLGYSDIAHLEHDPDLETVRDDPAYSKLLSKHGWAR